MKSREKFQYWRFIKKNVSGALLLFALGLFCYALSGGEMTENGILRAILPLPQQEDTAQQKLALPFDQTIPEENYYKEDYQTPQYITTIGENDIIYQPETDFDFTDNHGKDNLTAADIEKLRNLDYLKKKFYIVDKRTDLTQADFNVDKLLNTTLTIDNSVQGPKILIFHTHASEMFCDSDPSNLYDGIVGAGERLKEILENEYGIQTLHHTKRYDVVNGKGQILGAYERMEPDIRKILAENPSIQVVIDLHRDGVAEGTHLVTTVDGKQCAEIMFFNGLCKLNKNGVLEPISGLSNPYITDNLALSFQMQLLANELYPGFTRKIYLNAYRYSLHMLPKSMLIEVGAQTNTKEEAFNAMQPLARLLAETLLKEPS